MEMSMEIFFAWSPTRAQQNKQAGGTETQKEWKTVPQRSRPAFVFLLFFFFEKVLFLSRTLYCAFKSEKLPNRTTGLAQFSHMFLSECL